MINYTNPDRERFVNIAAMALFNVPANEEVTVVDIIDKLRSHYQIIIAADYYPNICCYYPYIRLHNMYQNVLATKLWLIILPR